MKMHIRISALAAASIAVIGVAASSARADITVVSEVSVTGIPAEAKAAQPGLSDQKTTTTVYYKGDKQRTESGNMVTIYDGTSDKLYTLNPAKKEYMVTAISDALGSLSGNPFLEMMKVNTTAKVEPGGVKKDIAGKPAMNYIYRATIKMTMDNLPPEAAGALPMMELKGEQWATEALSLPEAFRTSAMMNMTKRLPAFMAKGMKPLTDELAKIKGMPLSSRISMSFVVPAGGPALPGIPKDPIITTTEVKSISEDALADSLFEIPKDYKKVDAPKTPGFPGGGGVSANPVPGGEE